MIYISEIISIDHLSIVDHRVTGRPEILKCKTPVLVTFKFPLKRQTRNRCCSRPLNPGRYGLFNKKLYQTSNRLKPPSAHGKTWLFKSFTDQPEKVIFKNGQVIKKNVTTTWVKLSCRWKRIPKLVKYRFFHPWQRNEAPAAVCISSFSNIKNAALAVKTE